MAYQITDDCINCTACEKECPTNAIFSHRTRKKNIERISKKHFFIIKAKCCECKGFFSIPMCLNICPVKSFIKISNYRYRERYSFNS